MTDLVPVPDTLDIAERQFALEERQFALAERKAEMLAQSSVVPKAYRGQPGDIMAAALYGKTFGWDITTSLRYIHIIEGTPSLATAAKVGLVHRAGHVLTGGPADDGQSATATGKRADTGATGSVTYTLSDADKAGLLRKRNWQQHPKSMLWARAVSQLCRQLFEDVNLGSYVEDEIAGNVKMAAPPGSASEPVEVERETASVYTLAGIHESFAALTAEAQEKINGWAETNLGYVLADLPDPYLSNAELDLLGGTVERAPKDVEQVPVARGGPVPDGDPFDDVADAEVVDVERGERTEAAYVALIEAGKAVTSKTVGEAIGCTADEALVELEALVDQGDATKSKSGRYKLAEATA